MGEGEHNGFFSFAFIQIGLFEKVRHKVFMPASPPYQKIISSE